MPISQFIAKAFRGIPNIGVTPDIRPEVAKHVRYLNIGFFLLAFINLAYFFQGLIAATAPPIILIAQVSVSALCAGVFVFNRLGRYTAARLYGFLLFYANCLFIFPLNGKDVVDHYMIFTAVGYAFLVFPRKEKGLMTSVIVLAFLCYIAVLILYEHVEPALQADPAALELANLVIVYVIMILFIFFMVIGKYLTDQMEDSLMEERKKLADMSGFLNRMCRQYLSPEVTDSLIENPSAMELGGERRTVTIMMTDLRGFTGLSERLEPEQVVQMLNTYLEVMVEIVFKYNGTINEIIGDALLVIFGAPQEMPDRTERAVACAIEMQNAMAGVNERNRSNGLPDLEMGIGLNEAEVIVGNIGSSKRSKYAVVGSGVNMTSRIEAYTVGGQILVSESVRQKAGEVLRIDAQRDVLPKGSEAPLRIYEVGGIAGGFNLALKEKKPAFVTLMRQIPLRYTVLEGKDVGRKGLEGSIIRISGNSAEISLGAESPMMTDLRMNLADVDERLSVKNFYGKVMKPTGGEGYVYLVYFTSLPPEVDAYFQAHRQHAAEPEHENRGAHAEMGPGEGPEEGK